MQNIIFDLGGVVFDWDPEAIIGAVFKDPELQAIIRREVFEHPDWPETDRGTLTRADAVVRWARRTARPVAELEALMHAADVSMQPKIGTLALMKELADQGLSLYCLSNMPAERYAYLRETYDLWGLFGGIVISAHVKMVKPDPGIFEHLLATYRLDPAATLFVDDSPKNISAARSVGIQGILFTTAEACRQQIELFVLQLARQRPTES
jgi:HAD superfamily hydrolase (TIGR01509 family)